MIRLSQLTAHTPRSHRNRMKKSIWIVLSMPWHTLYDAIYFTHIFKINAHQHAHSRSFFKISLIRSDCDSIAILIVQTFYRNSIMNEKNAKQVNSATLNTNQRKKKNKKCGIFIFLLHFRSLIRKSNEYASYQRSNTTPAASILQRKWK